MTFLRPHALWLLIPVIALYAFLVWRRGAALRNWRAHIAEHLLDRLIVGTGKQRGLRPVHLLGFVLVLGVLAVAGPAWRREPSPFTEDAATLMVAIDLSKTMEAKDVRPSRYERATQKVRDILATRSGARTGLIAYAGSAHLVLPPTRDASLVETFSDSLSPELMPKDGVNAAAALELADSQLDASGTILFLTANPVPAASSNRQVLVLTMGRNVEPDVGGAFATPVTVDDSDVRRIAKRIDTHFVAAQSEDETGRWKDSGYWLTLPLVVLGLLWFRRGWLVAWD